MTVPTYACLAPLVVADVRNGQEHVHERDRIRIERIRACQHLLTVAESVHVGIEEVRVGLADVDGTVGVDILGSVQQTVVVGGAGLIGSHTVDRVRVRQGLWKYRVIPNFKVQPGLFD